MVIQKDAIVLSGPSGSGRSTIVLSGPSGSGKNFKIKAMLARDDNLGMPVCATTRLPRPGEKHGVDYFFLTREEFLLLRAEGGFVETAEVHGNLYGTPRRSIEVIHEDGKDALFDVDVQGARQIKVAMPEVVSVFLMPPSKTKLEQQLRGRGTDKPEVIERRLYNAFSSEIPEANSFDYIIVNDSDDYAAADEELYAIIRSSRLRPAHHRQIGQLEEADLAPWLS